VHPQHSLVRHRFQTLLTGTRAVGRRRSCRWVTRIVVWKLIPIVRSHPRAEATIKTSAAPWRAVPAGAVVSSVPSSHHAAAQQQQQQQRVISQPARRMWQRNVPSIVIVSSSSCYTRLHHHYLKSPFHTIRSLPRRHSTCLAGHIFISSLFSFSVIGIYTYFCLRAYSSSRRL